MKTSMPIIACALSVLAGEGASPAPTTTEIRPPVDTCRHWCIDREDPLWKPHSQLMEGYSLWLLRQKMSIEGTQTIVEAEIAPERGRPTELATTTYLPLLATEEWGLSTGTRFRTQELDAGIPEHGTHLQHLWLWTAAQWTRGPWRLTQTTETYWKGDDAGLYDEPGKEFFVMDYAAWEFSPRWNLVLLAGWDRKQAVGRSLTRWIGGGQLRWQPSPTLKILTGVPTPIAVEWTLPTGTDLGCAWFLPGETSAFVQQRFGRRFDLALAWSAVDEAGSWFSPRTLDEAGRSATFDEVRTTHRKLSLEAGVLASRRIGVNLGVAWHYGGDLSLWRDGNLVADDLRTGSYPTIGVRFQYLDFGG